MKDDADRIVRLDIGGDAVFHWLHFFLVGAKKDIPKDEYASIVLVDILRIHAMMHPVCRRRYYDILQKTQMADVLGMRPYRPY